jgi:hypothetical protein
MLAIANDNDKHGIGVHIFAAGPSCCAACAPSELSRSVVETEVARKEPRGSVLVWRAFAEPIGGDRLPKPCPHHAGRQHWLLVREIKR